MLKPAWSDIPKAGEAGFAGNCDVIIVADVSGLLRSSNAWKSRPTVAILDPFSPGPKRSISSLSRCFSGQPLTDFHSSAQLPNKRCELPIGSGTFQRNRWQCIVEHLGEDHLD